jgi:putative SOS response-associated peptidase YedK
MCGRYTLIKPAAEVAAHFDAADPPLLDARYNIAPTQKVFVIRQRGESRVCSLARWGLVPPWAKLLNDGPPLINARAETVTEKPTFRSAFKRRRCLVPADGFYEWKAEGSKKLPHYFTLAEGQLFAFAGIWERWDGGEAGIVESVATLTTEPNELVRPVHNRMPVILPAEVVPLWLDPRQEDVKALAGLLGPYPASVMSVRLVGHAVGNVRSEGPQCIKPAGPVQAVLF